VNEPERVIGFLNQSMTIIVDAITRAGGDVDKLIGDAVLARFQGVQAEVRAIAAAREALHLLEMADLPRGVGIGIYTGEVISGTVGSADRMDFTVIGQCESCRAPVQRGCAWRNPCRRGNSDSRRRYGFRPGGNDICQRTTQPTAGSTLADQGSRLISCGPALTFAPGTGENRLRLRVMAPGPYRTWSPALPMDASATKRD
jgi:hypothetical protein